MLQLSAGKYIERLLVLVGGGRVSSKHFFTGLRHSKLSITKVVPPLKVGMCVLHWFYY